MLKLTTAIYEAMRTHGEETYPHECCGVLLGRSAVGVDEVFVNIVESAVRAGNTRTDSPRNRYNIAPQELVKIQRQARESGLDIVGFYHSHPDHPAQWSATDLAGAHWLACSYVITSVREGAAQETEFLPARRRQRRGQSPCSGADRGRRRKPGKGQRDIEEHSRMKIHIPTPLRVYTGKQDTVVVTAATVGEALSQLTNQHPDLKKHLYTDDGKLRSFVNVYLNDEDVRYLPEKDTTVVTEADALTIIPSIAGGTSRPGGRVRARTLRTEGKLMATILEELPATLPDLSNEEIARYSRHLLLPEVGMEGQKKLKAAKVLCVGTGGLGSPLALYLAAAGVGTIGLVDFDVVDSSNLQRQIIHSTKSIGRPKIDSAEERLKGLNPFINIVKFETMLTSANALEIISQFDVIADGTDNFPDPLSRQ